MRQRNSKKIFKGILCACWLCMMLSCLSQPESVSPADAALEIYPDYQDVVIPYNIAPLNFLLRDERIEAVSVCVKGVSDSLRVTSRGRKVIFPLKKWQRLLATEKGHVLKVVVCGRIGGAWQRYPAFGWEVVPQGLDAYVTYRLIEPGYEVWNALQIRERCIENFEEHILADNSQLDRECMNCHVHGKNSGELSMFHLRGKGGGTILNRDGKLRKLALQNDKMVSAAVYGDFHPSGRYAVFSSNIILPMFHAMGNRRLEVYDTQSDLVVADFDSNRLIFSPITADSLALETFPTFSADGNWIYFCSAPVVPLPDSILQLRYSLCRIAFHAERGAWGGQVDTLWNARLRAGSVCHPKASPDGRFLLYTVADYGTFPIWHRETELQLMNLETGAIDSLSIVHSNRSDTYHSWSSNSRWMAFASKRGDGLYGRIYFAYLDTAGKAHKPFVLPQADPEDDDLNLKSYNIPDLSKTSVPFDAASVKRIKHTLEAESFD